VKPVDAIHAHRKSAVTYVETELAATIFTVLFERELNVRPELWR
jgi:hypothetical protein